MKRKPKLAVWICSTVIFLVSGIGLSLFFQQKRGTERTEALLIETILPSVEFEDTSLIDAIEILRADAAKVNPEFETIRFVEFDFRRNEEIDLPRRSNPDDTLDPHSILITLHLRNVLVMEALRYTTALAQYGFSVSPDKVMIQPMTPGMKVTVTQRVSNWWNDLWGSSADITDLF
ncbi:MAG: hypothetical protein HKN23_18410 [Verrucomicrobiales bacterium]|nr:hypothetical protein [Verrucomicrobiales bacterium]